MLRKQKTATLAMIKLKALDGIAQRQALGRARTLSGGKRLSTRID